MDGVGLSVEENEVLEILDWRCSEGSAEMKTNVSLFLYSFVFLVILRFTEALHECFESSPVPICFCPCLTSHSLCDFMSRSHSFKVCSWSVGIKIEWALHPFSMIG